ncbi:MAG: YdeI/OmpD-associated family protein [Flavobacteriales bacterium]|nr:YdeI/OmpD-associated family protein [Flavobacteriales bacterium]
MASKLDSLERVEVTSRAEWRAWLKTNHKRTEGIWLITYKKHVADKYVGFDEKVQEALCFGWIDSLARTLDADRIMQYLSPRKPNSVWSAINKAHVERLIAQKRMTTAGLKKIEIAKANGSWTAIDAAEALEVPSDLLRAFYKNRAAHNHYEAFPPSARKQIIRWVLGAKTDGTRARRIAEVVLLAAQNIRANQQVVKAKG